MYFNRLDLVTTLFIQIYCSNNHDFHFPNIIIKIFVINRRYFEFLHIIFTNIVGLTEWFKVPKCYINYV